MILEIMSIVLPFAVLAWAVFNWFEIEKLRKESEADLKQAEAELKKSLKNRDEALKSLEDQKKKYAEFIQKHQTGDPMSNTHTTSINTSAPKTPSTNRGKSTPISKGYGAGGGSTSKQSPSSASVAQGYGGGGGKSSEDNGLWLRPDLFIGSGGGGSEQVSGNDSSPIYDSGPSSYESFGGGSSDGGGASSDW